MSSSAEKAEVFAQDLIAVHEYNPGFNLSSVVSMVDVALAIERMPPVAGEDLDAEDWKTWGRKSLLAELLVPKVKAVWPDDEKEVRAAAYSVAGHLLVYAREHVND